MFGSLFFLGLATFSAAFFQYESYLQEGIKIPILPQPFKFVIPSRQCNWNMSVIDVGCLFPYTLAVKVSDWGVYHASPKVNFYNNLYNIQVERKSIFCLGTADVEVRVACENSEIKVERIPNKKTQFDANVE